MVPIARISVWKVFCKLSNHLWRSLFLVKLYGFNIFFSTPLDGCIWSAEVIPWDASYFRHSDNLHVAVWNYTRFIARTSDANTLKMKSRSPINVIKSKKNNVSSFFLIGHTFWFCAPVFVFPIGCSQKIGIVEINLSSHWNSW